MHQVPLYATAQVTCDSSGNGRCYLGPNRAGVSWEVRLMQVSNDSQVNQSEVIIYIGAVGPSYQYGGTWSGNMDTNNDVLQLQTGDQLWAVWSGADAGSHSQLLLSGVVRDRR